MKPIFEFPKDKLEGHKQNELLKVKIENSNLHKRIKNKSSVYNTTKWERDYKKSQYYKSNVCQYPPINFMMQTLPNSRGMSFNPNYKGFYFSNTGFKNINKEADGGRNKKSDDSNSPKKRSNTETNDRKKSKNNKFNNNAMGSSSSSDLSEEQKDSHLNNEGKIVKNKNLDSSIEEEKKGK